MFPVLGTACIAAACGRSRAEKPLQRAARRVEIGDVTTWVVGDIHGCADELAELVGRLALAAGDALVCVGDLFHRGPDPAGVARLLRSVDARFVLGNHEHRVLARLALADERLTRSDAERASVRSVRGPLEARDLDGDGRQPCDVAPHERAAIVEFLLGHSGYLLRRSALPHAGPTADGREWLCAHAGVLPGVAPESCSIEVLTRVRRRDGAGEPWWYEVYDGPDLVLFGHTPSRIPRMRRAHGRLVALGLDTGCVYGGRLTAYSPERDAFVSVAAARAYARA